MGSMTSFEFMMCGWQSRKQQIMHPQPHISKQRSIRAVVSSFLHSKGAHSFRLAVILWNVH